MSRRKENRKRRPSMRATLPLLPMEVLSIEILPRLPVKSLFRFKCVSKSFESLISSPHLAILHLHHRSHSLSSSSDHLLIVKSTNELCGIDMGSLSSLNIYNPIKLQLPVMNVNAYNRSIIGSFNGLLCIINYADLYIFNPLLPKCNYRKIPLGYDKLWRVEREYFGFGYGSAADDYKIVRILERSCDEGPLSKWERNVMIYSLRANSWKSIQNRWPCYDHGSDAINGVLIGNSLLHWMFLRWKGNYPKHYIGCFDLNEEHIVDDIPLPDEDVDSSSGYHHHKYVNLGVLDGCLCLSTMIRSVVHVWIMKEYEVKESWVKLASISYQYHIYNDIPIVSPVVYGEGSRSKVLLHEKYDDDHKSKMMWCDLSYTKNIHEVISGLSGCSEVYLHIPSLITIPNIEKRLALKDQPKQKGRLIEFLE